LERDQRRDHDRRPVTQESRKLVDRRLAAARGEHGEHVAALDSSPRGFELARTQPLEPEARPRELLDRPLAHAKTLPPPTGKTAPTSIVEATLRGVSTTKGDDAFEHPPVDPTRRLRRLPENERHELG